MPAENLGIWPDTIRNRGQRERVGEGRQVEYGQ